MKVGGGAGHSGLRTCGAIAAGAEWPAQGDDARIMNEVAPRPRD